VDSKASWSAIGATFGRTEEACKKHYSKIFPVASTSSSSTDAHLLLLGDTDELTSTFDMGTVSAPITPNKWLVKSLKRWTVEEDEQLRQLVETFGRKSWAVIAAKLQGRSSDACECRWRDKLYPKLLTLEKELRDHIVGGQDVSAASVADKADKNAPAGNVFPSAEAILPMQSRYSVAEDELLRSLIETYGSSGNASWEKIASLMNGRSINSCRMRWKQALRHTVESTSSSTNMLVSSNNAHGATHVLLNSNNSSSLNAYDAVK